MTTSTSKKAWYSRTRVLLVGGFTIGVSVTGYWAGSVACRVRWHQNVRFDEHISHYSAASAYSSDNRVQALQALDRHLAYLSSTAGTDQLPHVHQMEVSLSLGMKASLLSDESDGVLRSETLTDAMVSCREAGRKECTPRGLMLSLKRRFPDSPWVAGASALNLGGSAPSEQKK